MALGTPVNSQLAVISVAPNTGTATSPVEGTYDPVSDLTNFSLTSNTPQTQVPVLQRATQYVLFGAQANSIRGTGLLSVGDTGGGTLRSARASGAYVYAKVLQDGTNGYKMLCAVGGGGHDIVPNQFQGTSFDLGGVAAPVIVGTGPLP